MNKQVSPSELPPYLYDKKGPWPQPSSIDKRGMAPEVIYLPPALKKEYNKTIGRHYKLTILFYWPIAIFKTLFSKYLEPVHDEEFSVWMGQSAFSKFLVDITTGYNKSPDQNNILPNGIHKDDPHLRDKVDIASMRKTFAAYLSNEASGSIYYISDFKLMEVVTPYEGMYVAPVVLLMELKPGNEEKIARAIYYYTGDFVVNSLNDKTWELSKYYVLMGANYRLTLSVHALLHFPMDSINAITQTVLNTSNPLFRLLYPHLQYSLGVDNAVLDSPESPVKNVSWLPYTLLTGPSQGIAELFIRGYLGDPDDPASYAKFLFKLEPVIIDSPYGKFMSEYYKDVKKFTDEVCVLIAEEIARDSSIKDDIAYWARSIHAWYPEFPDETAIFEDDNLSKATAIFIWDVSIAHTADHYNFSFQTTPQQAPFRIRQSPPTSPDSISHLERKKLNRFVDQFKYHYIRKLFFEPYVVSALMDCVYSFENKYLNERLQEAVIRFKENLRKTDSAFEIYRERGYKYIPLNKIASSIQF